MVEKKKPHVAQDGEASKPTHITHKKSKLDKLEGSKVLTVDKKDVQNEIEQDVKITKKEKKQKKAITAVTEEKDEENVQNNENKEEGEENEDNKNEAESSEHVNHKIFFLSIRQLKEKEAFLQQRVKELLGGDNKNKRKRMFYELKQISNALENPAKYVRDPMDEAFKKRVDLKKRVQKKISKKRINENKKKSDARRERRQIVGMQCLGCKEVGHLVADCPNVKIPPKQMQNICYNCGSSDHSLKDCKKKKNGSTLKFAFCFVCKKNGHISRDCPQNPNGLYVKGGGCFICGDVHHTQQNCPKNPINSIKAAREATEKVPAAAGSDQDPSQRHHKYFRKSEKDFKTLNKNNKSDNTQN